MAAVRTELVVKDAPRVSTTGAITTTGITIPADAKGEVELLLDLDPTELLDTGRSLWFHVYEFVGGGWRHVCGAQWSGGPNSDPELGNNINPRLWLDIARIAGKTVRIEVDDPKGQQVGYKLTLRT